MTRSVRRATDHRSIVLEAVATAASNPSAAEIAAEVVRVFPEFSRKNILTMVSTLRREGLIGMNESRTHFITQAGIDWLKHGRFDRALPTFAERPKSRKRRPT